MVGIMVWLGLNNEVSRTTVLIWASEQGRGPAVKVSADHGIGCQCQGQPWLDGTDEGFDRR